MDLQKKYKIDQIKLIGQQNTSNASVVYNLHTSTDGVKWILIQSGTLVSSLDPEKYMNTIPLTTGNVCQYVKYEVVGGTNLPMLYEMEIWGGPNPVTRPSPLSVSCFWIDLFSLEGVDKRGFSGEKFKKTLMSLAPRKLW